MERYAFRVSAADSVVSDVQTLAVACNGACSEPQPASSNADPLNAPISGGDIQATAQVLTVVFTAGAACVKFVEGLLKLAESRKARIKVRNVETKATRVLTNEEDVKHLTSSV
jgi:3-hydroxyisobutyrate dehydrogenase-like beta-hydroxyacid dehydrogenase